MKVHLFNVAADCALPALAYALLACESPRAPAHADSQAAIARADTGPRIVYRVRRRASAIQRVNGPLVVHRALEAVDSLLAVRILDARGASLQGVPVRWTAPVLPDGAAMHVVNAITDAGGVARAAFTPGPTASAQHVFAAVPGVGRIDFAVFVPAATMHATPAAVTVWSGDTVTLHVRLADSAGVALAGGALGWASTDTSVARVSVAGDATARVSGALAGNASIVAWIGFARDTIHIVVRPEVDVEFVTLDARQPPVMRVEVRSGVLLDSATVRDGHYHRRVPGVGDDVEIRAQPLDSTRAYQDIAVRVQRPRDLQSLRIALVGRVWRVDAGTYAGRAIAIDAEAAMQRGTADAAFWRLVPVSGRGPRTLLGWAPDKLPLHLAFDRRALPQGIDAADSLAFWAAARQMERDLGRALFVPAELADTARFDVIPVGVRPQPAEGHTFLSWGDAGDATDGTMRFRSEATLRDPGVVTHELLHLIGFGHTLVWPSVARPVGGSESGLTPQDVAYVQLALRLREFQRSTGARPGLPLARQ